MPQQFKMTGEQTGENGAGVRAGVKISVLAELHALGVIVAVLRMVKAQLHEARKGDLAARSANLLLQDGHQRGLGTHNSHCPSTVILSEAKNLLVATRLRRKADPSSPRFLRLRSGQALRMTAEACGEELKLALLRRAHEHLNDVVVHAIVTLPLEGPLELRVLEVARVHLKIVSVQAQVLIS